MQPITQTAPQPSPAPTAPTPLTAEELKQVAGGPGGYPST